MSGQNERLRELIEPTATAEGFELVRIRLTGAKTKTLQVMAERPDRTMTAEDCAKLSRAVSAALDEADPIEGQYVLEVSSPGIDRPLTRLKDFDAWQGYRAKVELDRLVEGRRRFQGVLGGVEDGAVVLDLDGEDEATLVPYEWIADAKLVLTDELIAESLRAAKAARKAAGDEGEDGIEDGIDVMPGDGSGPRAAEDETS